MPSKTAQPASPAKPATSAKLPVKTFRLGRIKAAVWENEADQKKFYNVTVARTYVDDAKNYHDTDSFGRDDLPLVAKLADHAHTFIFERIAELKFEQSERPSPPRRQVTPAAFFVSFGADPFRRTDARFAGIF